MRKYSSWIVIGIVILIAVGVAIGITFSGIKNGDHDYVAIDINPNVEFILKKGKIESVYAGNTEGRMVIFGEDFKDMKIEEGVKKVIDKAAKMGYLNVDANQDNNANAIRLTVVSGLTNRREVKVYRTIQEYLQKHEILGVIVDNEKDMQMVKRAKKNNMPSVDKLYLIDSIMRQDKEADFKQLKKKNNEDLLDRIAALHKEQSLVLLDSEAQMREERLAEFTPKFDDHIAKVNKKTSRAFNEMYTKYNKSNHLKFERNFPQNEF